MVGAQTKWYDFSFSNHLDVYIAHVMAHHRAEITASRSIDQWIATRGSGGEYRVLSRGGRS